MTVMAGKRVALAAVAALIWIGASDAAEREYTGATQVLDGNTLQVAGIPFRLADSAAPMPGETCFIARRSFDCGHVARTALMDLVAGAVVRCTAVAGIDNTYRTPARCTADGFDIARNMVHTGWAVAAKSAPAEFRAVEAKARKSRNGLWRTAFVRPRQGVPRKPVGEICVRIAKIGNGVECDAFISPAGRTYTATRGAVLGVMPQTGICLCGVPARMSICMQGKTLSVMRLKPLSKCP